LVRRENLLKSIVGTYFINNPIALSKIPIEINNIDNIPSISPFQTVRGTVLPLSSRYFIFLSLYFQGQNALYAISRTETNSKASPTIESTSEIENTFLLQKTLAIICLKNFSFSIYN
jgi:hypothetical protein